MSKKERIKSMFDLLKSLLMAFLFALFGVISYAFVHIRELNVVEFIVIVFAVLIDLLIISVIAKNIIYKLDELERIE